LISFKANTDSTADLASDLASDRVDLTHPTDADSLYDLTHPTDADSLYDLTHPALRLILTSCTQQATTRLPANSLIHISVFYREH